MANNWQEEHKKKLIAPEDLEKKIQEIRESGKTIATLNGSFDLLHAGHLQIIYEASRTADVLIMALNSDESIRQYKSPLRPIISLPYRLQIVAALQFVSFATWFEELDPRRVLSIIKPDTHVNGAEYGENCLEADIVKANGGSIHIVNILDGLSTSQILKKIESLSHAPVD